MDTTVGTCGNCGGAVTVPAAWYATIPPTPTCVRCGAAAKMQHGPVLPMEEPRRAVPGDKELWCARLAQCLANVEVEAPLTAPER